MDLKNSYITYKNPDAQSELKRELIDYFCIIRDVALTEYGKYMNKKTRKYLLETKPQEIIQVEYGPDEDKYFVDNDGRRIVFKTSSFEILSDALTKISEIPYKTSDKDSIDRCFKELHDGKNILKLSFNRMDILKYTIDTKMSFKERCLSELPNQFMHFIVKNFKSGFLKEGVAELLTRELVQKHPNELKYWLPDKDREYQFACMIKDKLGGSWKAKILGCHPRGDTLERLKRELGMKFSALYTTNQWIYEQMWGKYREAIGRDNLFEALNVYEEAELLSFSKKDTMNNLMEMIKTLKGSLNIVMARNHGKGEIYNF